MFLVYSDTIRGSPCFIIPICHILYGMCVGDKFTPCILADERSKVVEVAMPALCGVVDDGSHHFRLHGKLRIIGVLITMVYVIPNETGHVFDVRSHVAK